MHDRETLAVSMNEAARLLGISRGLAYAAVARGELPTLRVGRRILVSRAGLERMCDANRQESVRACRRTTAVLSGES